MHGDDEPNRRNDDHQVEAVLCAYASLDVQLAAGVLYRLFRLLLRRMIAAALLSRSSVLVVVDSLQLRRV